MPSPPGFHVSVVLFFGIIIASYTIIGFICGGIIFSTSVGGNYYLETHYKGTNKIADDIINDSLVPSLNKAFIFGVFWPISILDIVVEFVWASRIYKDVMSPYMCSLIDSFTARDCYEFIIRR